MIFLQNAVYFYENSICLRENQVAICTALSSHVLMLVIYFPCNIILMKLSKR